MIAGDPRGHRALIASWQRLAASSIATAPFTSPSWIQAHIDAFEPTARRITIVVPGGSEARAVLPLVRTRAHYLGVPVTLLRQPSRRRVPERFDLLLADPDDGRAIASIWRTLSDDHRWDVLELAEVPEHGAALALAELASQQDFAVSVTPGRAMPYLSLEAASGSFDAAVAGTSAKFRANVRRRMRNLEKRGDVRLTLTTTADPARLDTFFAMEAAGWKGTAGTAIASDPRTARYHRAIARIAADRGELALYALECDGIPVAMHLGLITGNRYLVPKLAYDESFHEFAPGHLLVQAVIRDCLRRGIAEFDFLGEQMAWKAEWTDLVRPSFRVTVFNRTLAGRAAHAMRFQIGPRVNRALISVRRAGSVRREDM